MSIRPPANATCPICYDEFKPEESFCKKLYSGSTVICLSGKEHPHACFFHRDCFEAWSYFSTPQEEDGHPYCTAGSSVTTLITKCPYDRCTFTHINGKAVDNYLIQIAAVVIGVAMVFFIDN